MKKSDIILVAAVYAITAFFFVMVLQYPSRFEVFKELLPYLQKEMKRKHVTLKLLWEEYVEEHPDDHYSLTQFRFHYNQNTEAKKESPSTILADMRWYDPSGRASDLVPLSVIKEHSIRSRRLATYNTIVKRGINIRNAYMWTDVPEQRLRILLKNLMKFMVLMI